ncbi:uncharacterized protein [Haliotis asinina]|uniref:uncharacterized protein isoform X2 n=1 Tax=Haliotis asinina TaxID=109174 RepID=UPI003532556D
MGWFCLFLHENSQLETNADPCKAKGCGANTKCNVKNAETARCIITECSETPKIPNATPLPCSRAVQTTVSFKCTEGHAVVDGPALLTCLANGSWTWPTFKCLVDCGTPPSVIDATFPQGIATTLGSHVTYTCAEGTHVERGRASTVCLDSGLWTRPRFVCETDRHKLLSVGPGGQMIQFDLPPGSEKPQEVDHRSHCVREAIYDIISGVIYFSAVGRPPLVGYRTLDNPDMMPLMAVSGDIAVGLSVDYLANLLFSCYYSKRYILASDKYGRDTKQIYVANGEVAKLALDREKRFVYFASVHSIGRVGYDGHNYVRLTRTAKPAGLYLLDNVLYICSSVNDDIRSFNLTSNKLQTIVWADRDIAHRCWDILVAKGHIYVSHIRKTAISKFSLKGEKKGMLEYNGAYRGIRALVYVP